MFEWGSEKEVIAIRGLNQELYVKMLAKAKQARKNVADLINDALARYISEEERPIPPDVTLVSGLTNISFSKSDLQQLGRIRVLECSNVKFKEDVDPETLDKHVESIESCTNVLFQRKLFPMILRKVKECTNLSPYEKEEPIHKIIFKEGLPEETVLFKEREDIAVIDHLGEIEISKEDLESLAKLNKKVVISHCKQVTFSKDVDVETFDKYVKMVNNCSQVKVPKPLYFIALAKLQKCERIEKY